MAAFIAGLSPVSHSGDVYARLKLKRG
jgi:hypothetical protein